MMKKQVDFTTKDGKSIEVHYVYDPKTGKKYDFKFTKHSGDRKVIRDKSTGKNRSKIKP
jgi:hypothetical protein